MVRAGAIGVVVSLWLAGDCGRPRPLRRVPIGPEAEGERKEQTLRVAK